MHACKEGSERASERATEPINRSTPSQTGGGRAEPSLASGTADAGLAEEQAAGERNQDGRLLVESKAWLTEEQADERGERENKRVGSGGLVLLWGWRLQCVGTQGQQGFVADIASRMDKGVEVGKHRNKVRKHRRSDVSKRQGIQASIQAKIEASIEAWKRASKRVGKRRSKQV